MFVMLKCEIPELDMNPRSQDKKLIKLQYEQLFLHRQNNHR